MNLASLFNWINSSNPIGLLFEVIFDSNTKPVVLDSTQCGTLQPNHSYLSLLKKFSHSPRIF